MSRRRGDNVGDTDGDGLLDVGETWLFTLHAADASAAATRRPAGQNIVNTATAAGTDPPGTTVTDTATDDVDAFNPAITLTKLVNGEEPVDDRAGGADGDVHLRRRQHGQHAARHASTLADDTPPCEEPTRGPDDPGNDDAILDVGETWTYCVHRRQPTAGRASTPPTVTATPLNPAHGNAPFPDPTRR